MMRAQDGEISFAADAKAANGGISETIFHDIAKLLT
jgi:hypothetical protein